MLHELEISHNDLRPESIFINFDSLKKNMFVKISLSFQFNNLNSDENYKIFELTNFSSPE